MGKKEFIVILSITFIVIVIWIITDILHTKSSVPVNTDLNKTLEPVNPSFDTETLKMIENSPGTESTR